MSDTREVRTVGIVGLGLVGGSLAHDLATIGVSVLGHDSDAATLDAALDSGIVDRPLGAHLERCGAVDLLVIAVPVSAAPYVLEAVVHADDRPVITDVCSTKRSVETAALGLGLGTRFVGGHPLAGSHDAGWAAAHRGMFRDARVYICPAPHAADAAIAAVERLWRRVGAHPERTDAASHDRLLARTSHLPQAAASALAACLRAAGIVATDLGPGGRDTTRLAGSSADVWTPIALDNADHLCTALAELGDTLAALRTAVEHRDAAAVHAFLDAASAWRR